MEVESKKLQMQLLETEIQNIQVKNQLKERTEADIKEQRAQMEKQIETLRGLTSALEVQLTAAWAFWWFPHLIYYEHYMLMAHVIG